MNNQRLVILLLLVAYIFSPSLFNWIINPEGAWYRPYIVWVIVIVIAFMMQIRRKNYHEFD
jgi:TctA family transporter